MRVSYDKTVMWRIWFLLPRTSLHRQLVFFLFCKWKRKTSFSSRNLIFFHRFFFFSFYDRWFDVCFMEHFIIIWENFFFHGSDYVITCPLCSTNQWDFLLISLIISDWEQEIHENIWINDIVNGIST